MKRRMEYFERVYDGVRGKVARFGSDAAAEPSGVDPKEVNGSLRGEAHAVLTCRDTEREAGMQLALLAEAARRLGDELGMTPVFERYMLSDPANQASLLPKMPSPDQGHPAALRQNHQAAFRHGCARSVIGQSPLDGSKGVLLVMYEENASFHQIGNCVWKDSAGRIVAGDYDSTGCTWFEEERAEYEEENAGAGGSHGMTVRYLERLARILEEYGGSLADNCLRTWFFVRDIDNNYRGVVTGRNEVFAKEGLTADTHFIASTGIGGTRPRPNELVAFNAIADLSVKPEQIHHLYGKTHLNPTYEYGVAFERGTVVDYTDRRHVYISGTASIDNKGEIVAPGDIKAQTERMLENISVLLREGECTREDVAHMIVYLRDIADFHIVRTIIEKRFPEIPKAFVLAPVCRPGWLVETECMAIRTQAGCGHP